VDIIYLDFQKAFDHIPHNRLLSKVKSYGIEGNLLKWIQNFLTNKKQQVNIRSSYSNWTNTTSNFPQGSVLGPILFLVFVNDIPEVVSSTLYMFADCTIQSDLLMHDHLICSRTSIALLIGVTSGRCLSTQLSAMQCQLVIPLSFVTIL